MVWSALVLLTCYCFGNSEISCQVTNPCSLSRQDFLAILLLLQFNHTSHTFSIRWLPPSLCRWCWVLCLASCWRSLWWCSSCSTRSVKRVWSSASRWRRWREDWRVPSRRKPPPLRAAEAVMTVSTLNLKGWVFCLPFIIISLSKHVVNVQKRLYQRQNDLLCLLGNRSFFLPLLL